MNKYIYIALLLLISSLGYAQCDISAQAILKKLDCDSIAAHCPNLGGGNPTDELQTLSQVGNTITLSMGGGTVTIVIPDNLDNDPTNECIQKVSNEKGEIIIVDACGEWTIPIENNVEGTRSQIAALASSDRLIPGCTYSITDYSRGCLDTEVESITIEAVSVDNFSQDAHILTTFDAEAWDGRYNIGTNRILELQDNRGNRANGQSGVEVDRFPWGDPQITETEVDRADLICDCDIVVRVLNSNFHTDSYTDLTGATGLIYYSHFTSNSDQRWTDATNIRIIASHFKSGSRTVGDNSVNARYDDYTISDNGYDGYSGMTDARRQYGYNKGGYVYYTGGTNQWLYQTEIGPRGTIRTASGNDRSYYVDISSYAETRNEAGAGLWYKYYSDYDSRGYVRNFNTNDVRHYAVKANSRGEIYHRDAAVHRFYYTTVADYSGVYFSGTATILYGSNLDSQSRFYATGGNHYRLNLSAFRRINTAFNTRAVYGIGSGNNTLTAPNNNTGVDYFNNSLQ